ncbi:hypothetical protein SAV14893_076560 [Streptomyces avermitilis]|uniref:Halogenase n=1 Tax=Streptomyces avermitilis TaxID=33903 RepID=A0A4D4M8W9_STRAX|nr:tryptophan 7-halogenase [Streptomyces avermitilis]GDY68263.1 hypothetical protein SAV14893_076560 [Streptomyces avermitilis]
MPLIGEYLADAKRVTEGPYGKLRVRKDYSYHQTTFWRPGLVLVGDAACFVDPVFSSGVHLATYSALLAARSINSALAGLVDEEQALGEFEARYRREFGVFYEFLLSFYDMHHDEDSYFWQAKKVTRTNRPELQSFVELIGGVSSGERALTDAEVLAKRFGVESEEFAEAVDELARSEDESMVPLFRSSVVREVMREGGQVQMRALLGEDAERETPLFDGGLVASPDGMFWLPFAPEGD